jgi:Mor family transcriptional regulator
MYVYETTNLVNGKKYIGVSVTKNNSDNYLGSGVLLKRAIKKYGVENFNKTIIKNFSSEEEARNYERVLIDELDAINDKNYYNLVAGGFGGGVKNHLVTDETKQKISNSHKGKKLSRKQVIGMAKSTLQYDLDGNFIKEFETKADAENEINSKMNRLIGDKICRIKGFLWKYKNGDIEQKIQSSKNLDRDKKNKLSKIVGKLSKEEAINLVKDKEIGLTYLELSKKYGVSKSCAYEIVTGKTYKWIWN